MLREYDCPHCGWRIDSLGGYRDCPRCGAVLPSHSPDVNWQAEEGLSTSSAADEIRPQVRARAAEPVGFGRLGRHRAARVGPRRSDSGPAVVGGVVFVLVLLCGVALWAFVDLDSDGLPAWRELQLHTNPFRADSDHDGLPDGWELDRGLDAQDPDTDHDGVPDRIEIEAGFDPRSNDTDHDGVSDLTSPPPAAPACPSETYQPGMSDARCAYRDPPKVPKAWIGTTEFALAVLATSLVAGVVATLWWRRGPAPPQAL